MPANCFQMTPLLFQLTAPQGGRHTAFDVSRTKTTDFNSRPREGADWHWDLWQIVLSRISTHGPARGPTFPGLDVITANIFQLTAPRGGRPSFGSPTYNSTIFQLTAPRGGRRCSPPELPRPLNFNSRPREGADFHFRISRKCSGISTHGPARGPTAILDNDPLSKIVFFILLHNFVSTHSRYLRSLTRRDDPDCG